MKRLITFSHDEDGNIANLSRIDPTLLGVKDLNSYTKNLLYRHGHSEPLLFFSLVLVTGDNHLHGRILGGSDSKGGYFIKDILGVLHVLELERLVAVLGLAFNLPYVPDDNLRKETDLLYFSMVENGFSFTTGMQNKAGKHILNVLNCANTHI